MKWGVRRYQNPDGTLTAAGKRRYQSEDHIRAKELRKIGVSKLSNEELSILNERLKLEKEFELYTTKQKAGESYVKKFLAEAGGKAVGAVVTAAAVYLGVKYGSKYLKSAVSDFTKEAMASAPNIAKAVGSDVKDFVATVGKDAAAAATQAGKKATKSTARSVEKFVRTNSTMRTIDKTLDSLAPHVDKLFTTRRR